jgi:uncharacterized membrane protein YfcA
LNFHAWEWSLLLLGSLLVGLSKTGITGLSLLFVGMFAAVMPAKSATGVVVPLLIIGDLIAVGSYREHTQWRHIRRLFPWAAVGIIVGYFALGRMDDRQARISIGAIVLSLASLHIYRRLRPVASGAGHGAWFAPVIGILAGFTTIVANASGPLVVIYLLAMGLLKMEYMGTAAVFFLLLNLFKTPFMISLGLINLQSLKLNLFLLPAMLAGAWLGKWILHRMNQRVFENIALVLTLLAGARMFF